MEASVYSNRSFNSTKTDTSVASSGLNRRFWTSAVDPVAIRCYSRQNEVIPAQPGVSIPKLPHDDAIPSDRVSTAELFQKPLSPFRTPLSVQSNKLSARKPRAVKRFLTPSTSTPTVRINESPMTNPTIKINETSMNNPPLTASFRDNESCASGHSRRASLADKIFSGSSKKPCTYRSGLYNRFLMSSQAPSSVAPPEKSRSSLVVDLYSMDSPSPTRPPDSVADSDKKISSAKPARKNQPITEQITAKNAKKTLEESPRVEISSKRSSAVKQTVHEASPLTVQNTKRPSTVTREDVVAEDQIPAISVEPSPHTSLYAAKKTVRSNRPAVSVASKLMTENNARLASNLENLIKKMQDESENTAVASVIIKSLTDLLLEKESYESVIDKQLSQLQQSTSLILQCSNANLALSRKIRAVTKTLEGN